MAENDWAQPAPEMLATARKRALGALQSQDAARKLARFYDTKTDYAGATIATIGHNAPDSIGADDLFATTLLSVDVPAKAARLLTGNGDTKAAVSSALRALPLGPLEAVDADGFAAMEVLYLHVKRSLAKASAKSSNPWVVASKLCARKRPDLFPVRDNVVCRLLDVQRARNFRIDWLVFQALMNDAEVSKALSSVRSAVEAQADDSVVLDTQPLRVLDAALWTSVHMS
ncbi:hypothetical protein GCM10009721_11880 [Terrabacter tumescens]|uniref:Uncharacterized protein n=1 Tax=Terrabacter tumescens TaxID=60443 RepID=A0ABQ2HQ70_9MICO|nr:DUF6308 family protein [Terrabacter tumescens]GGM88430.1 hypothetical protein GCM10009721_11880 [Terrabacter tumescens]